MTDHSKPISLPSLPEITTYKKRYHRDANYESSPITLKLFSVYQICDLACASDHVVRQHTQICHEISYIVSGEGIFFRNGKAYDVYPNMVFLNKNQDVHSIKSSKDSPLRFMCLGFAFHKDHPDFPKYANMIVFPIRSPPCTFNPLSIKSIRTLSMVSLLKMYLNISFLSISL